MKICPICNEKKEEEDFRGDICVRCKVSKGVKKAKEIFETLEAI